jgi:hypothetical protein
MKKIIDCGSCDHGLLNSPKMITCSRLWPWKDHRRSFGVACLYWKERREGKIYYDYDNPEEKPCTGNDEENNDDDGMYCQSCGYHIANESGLVPDSAGHVFCPGCDIEFSAED